MVLFSAYEACIAAKKANTKISDPIRIAAAQFFLLVAVNLLMSIQLSYSYIYVALVHVIIILGCRCVYKGKNTFLVQNNKKVTKNRHVSHKKAIFTWKSTFWSYSYFFTNQTKCLYSFFSYATPCLYKYGLFLFDKIYCDFPKL